MMNILVLVKQVPDTSEIKIDKVTNTLIRTGNSIINPDDLAGIEEALRLKEQYGGKISTVTMGPLHAENMIRNLYARGVDHAYLLSDKKFAGSDTWSTSYILSKWIQTLSFDLIIAGYQAIDGDTAQVGPQVAEFLDLPQVTHLQSIQKVEAGYIYVTKAYEHELVELRVQLPCLLTTVKDMNKPRLMNAFDIWTAFDKPVDILTVEALQLDLSLIGLTGSPTKVKRTYTKEVVKRTPKEVLEPKDAARKIAHLLYPYLKGENQ